MSLDEHRPLEAYTGRGKNLTRHTERIQRVRKASNEKQGRRSRGWPTDAHEQGATTPRIAPRAAMGVA